MAEDLTGDAAAFINITQRSYSDPFAGPTLRMLAYIRHNQCRPLASATSSPTPISCLIQIFGDCIFASTVAAGRRRVCEIGDTYMVVFCGIASEYTVNSG